MGAVSEFQALAGWHEAHSIQRITHIRRHRTRFSRQGDLWLGSSWCRILRVICILGRFDSWDGPRQKDSHSSTWYLARVGCLPLWFKNTDCCGLPVYRCRSVRMCLPSFVPCRWLFKHTFCITDYEFGFPLSTAWNICFVHCFSSVGLQKVVIL